MWTSEEELKPKVTSRGFEIFTGDRTLKAAMTGGSTLAAMLLYDVVDALTHGPRNRYTYVTPSHVRPLILNIVLCMRFVACNHAVLLRVSMLVVLQVSTTR